MKRVFSKAKGVLTRLLLERRLGIDTEDVVELQDLRIDPRGRSNYIPSGWGTMKYIAEFRPVKEGDVFVDFGSGKGRMLVLAARYPFLRVAGVELSSELHDIAQLNVARTRAGHECRSIELHNCDASEWQVPDDMTFAYFFNPFVGAPFERVVENIGSSYHRKRRRISIFYTNPVMHDYLSSRPWLSTRVHVPKGVAVYETE